MNAAWIERRDGPVWLLWCSTGSADNDYPTQADSRALVALLSNFTFVRQVGKCALLKRTSPLLLAPGLPHRQTLSIGEALTLFPESGSLVWAELTVQETLLGKLVRNFLKPAPLLVEVGVRDGRTAHHVMLPTLTSQGFLLSPYPASWQTLEAAASGSGTADSVATLRLVGWNLGLARSDRFYEPEVQVTLTALHGQRR